jgi:hypothetical protein
MWNPFISSKKAYIGTDFVTDGIQANSLNVLEEYCDSGRTMALGLTQPLKEMSTRNISWG